MSATREYTLYCGNPECPTRLAFEMHTVAEDDLPDGEVWYCPECRSQ
jgi:hypothetical protein